MKRGFSLLLVIMLLAMPASVLADSTFRMAGYDNQSVNHDWNNNFFFQRMEKRTGVSFTFHEVMDLEQWTAEKQTYLKGKDLPDVLFKAELTPAETLELYEAGVLIDLKPYLKEYAPNLTALFAEHPEWEQAVTLPNGAIAALPYINTLQSNNVMWINTVWLKNVGMDMPTTAEELTEVLRAFKTQDPNRNGKKDETPLTFTGMWDLRFLAHAFGIYSNDYYVYADNGTVRETVTSDENRAFLEWLHQLWTEGLIDKLGFISTDSTRQITDSSAAITYGIVFGPSILNLLPNEQLANYDVLQPLKYEGKQVYRDLLGDVARGTFAITSQCSDPALLISWVDYLYSEEGCYLAQAGRLDEEYEVHSDGTWSWIENIQHVTEVIIPEYTISEGGMTPGYTPVSYQLNYDDASTQRAVKMLMKLKDVSAEPYPLVYLGADAQARLNELWTELALCAENTMAQFVVGDLPLTDANWQAFCERLEQLGLSETVSIWQNAL